MYLFMTIYVCFMQNYRYHYDVLSLKSLSNGSKIAPDSNISLFLLIVSNIYLLFLIYVRWNVGK